MNPALTSDLAVQHTLELQRATSQRRRDTGTWGTDPCRTGPWALRRQLGFTLVEVGLRLLREPAHTTY
jgi:hypothetical protein